VDKADWQKKGAGHRARLRDRFIENRLEGFSASEVLELLLSFGTPRIDCKEPARNLLKKFGTFAKVIESPAAALQEIHGVGPKNCFALHFVQEVAAYYLKERIIGKRYLHSSQDVIEYLVHSLRGLKKEVLSVIFLDSSHAIIDSAVVAEGTLNVNTIYPREIIKKALDYHAAALIIAHNHPSGALKPSQQDIKLTKNLLILCSSMQIQLLDHLIIGDGVYSFADGGLLAEIRTQCSSILNSL
jgi:DNA repair protein RadC